MNKIMFIAKQFAVIIIMVCFVVVGHAEVHNATFSAKITKSQLQERLDLISSDVSLKYTDEVHELVDAYIRASRQSSEKLLGRTRVFFPIFEMEMANYDDLPEEIKNLSIIESGLDVRAVSRVGAVGLWQFMRSTGKLQGLTINGSIDERRDPYLSTKAAIDYLLYLHNEFGDWTLAMAAYNCGPGNLRKAIRRSQSTNFWILEKYLPKETRRYIPKLIAATYLMSYYDNHRLEPRVTSPKFERTAIARIHEYTNISDIARETGLTVSEIKELNPAVMGNYIPRSEKGVLLTLPEKTMFRYLAKKGTMDKLVFTLANPKQAFESTVIFSGFQLRKAELEMFNSMPALISMIKGPYYEQLKYKLPMDRMVRDTHDYEYHKLEFGESLVDLVARLSNTTLEDLILWNQLDLNNPPKPGDFIKVKKT